MIYVEFGADPFDQYFPRKCDVRYDFHPGQTKFENENERFESHMQLGIAAYN